MRLSTTLLAFFLVAGLTLSAQEKAPTPVTEVGLNYSLLRWNPGGTVPSFNSNGATGTFQYNLTKSLGLVGDLGVYRLNDSSGITLDNTTVTYMGGPRWTFRASRFSPYVQALFGGSRLSNGFDSSVFPPRLANSQNVFTSAFGGGFQYRLTDHIYVRPAQLEYLVMRFPAGAAATNYTQNNMRYSAGVVFGFGSK